MDLFLLAFSPQMQILEALLWVGGMAILGFCGSVVRWGIALARVPTLHDAPGETSLELRYRYWGSNSRRV